MNKYFIQINENEKGLYDFLIEFINEETMEEKVCLGIRENVDSLSECYNMIEDFPLSPASELNSVQLNRYNEFLKPTVLEVLFNASMRDLIDSGEKNIKEYVFN